MAQKKTTAKTAAKKPAKKAATKAPTKKPEEHEEAPIHAPGEVLPVAANGVPFNLRWVPAEDKFPGFWLGETPVTQALWEAVTGSNPSKFKGADRPVENVSDDDCRVFFRKLNALESVRVAGLLFRIPTRFKWRRACRAGSKDFCRLADGTELPKEMLGRVAWTGENSDGETHPVGQKEPNAWGFRDMFGNVPERVACQFLMGGSYDRAAADMIRDADYGAYSREYSGEKTPVGGLRLYAAAAVRTVAVGDTPFNLCWIPADGDRPGFWMGETPVTNALWTAVTGEDRLRKECNAVRVSPDDCVAFLEKLNGREDVRSTGLEFRLPTEEERRFACRTGSGQEYCRAEDGSRIGSQTLWRVGYESSELSRHDHAVAWREPNFWGLYDVIGDVDNRTVPDVTQTKDGQGVRVGESRFRLLARVRGEEAERAERARGEADRARRERAEAARAERPKSPRIRTATAAGVSFNLCWIPADGDEPGFWMGETPVTQELWAAVAGFNPSWFAGDDQRPVEQVSWNDCQAFLGRLNAMEDVRAAGLVFVLPTAAERWRALQLKTLRKKGALCKLANGTEVTEKELSRVAWTERNGGGRTHPVAQREPNALGLYDLIGNVDEWLRNPYGNERYRAGGGSEYPWHRDSETGFRLCVATEREAEAVAAREAKARKEREEDRRFLEKTAGTPPATVSAAGFSFNLRRIPEQGKRPGFWMGETPVTQALWEAVMGENPSRDKDAENPVENVSWDDCQTFLGKLNALPEAKASGLVFRLPTEEEWELAALAGAKPVPGQLTYGRLSDGTQITAPPPVRTVETLDTFGDFAFAKNEDPSFLDEIAWAKNYGEKHPVGQKKPNAFGLYDVIGNVWQWTSTTHADDRVLRGGSRLDYKSSIAPRTWEGWWRDQPSARGWAMPSKRLEHAGLRLCAETPREVAERTAREAADRAAREEAVRTPPREVSAAGVPFALRRIPAKGDRPGFWMGETKVTRALWTAVTGNAPNPPDGDGQCPVEGVSWNGCRTFLEKINALPEAKASGLVFRLPTAEEWKFACRAGATGGYCLLADGTEVTKETYHKVAWYQANDGGRRHPVGQREPNAWGLHGMLDSVPCEWSQTDVGGLKVKMTIHDADSIGTLERPDSRCLGFRLCADLAPAD